MCLTTSTNKKSNKNTKSNKDLWCNYCSYKGHKESTCFKKFPNLRKEENKKSINNTSIIEEEQVLATSISSNINNKSNNSNSIDFILDSGATIHTCSMKEIFTSIKPTNISIKWGSTNKTIKAEGIGSINIIFSSTRQLVKFSLS